MLRCVCYLNSVKHVFGLQFLRLVTNELICNKGDSVSSFLVAVLMRDSFIVALYGLSDCTEETFNVLEMFRIARSNPRADKVKICRSAPEQGS